MASPLTSPDQHFLADDAGLAARPAPAPARCRRTDTASAWVPALPPIPAMIGMNTASHLSSWIASEKTSTTEAATNAVSRLT